jgi:hypothetical protein
MSIKESFEMDEAQVTFAEGRISLKSNPARGEAYGDILRRNLCAHFIEVRRSPWTNYCRGN